MPKDRTVAVDLDGTLAHYDGWKGPEHIGKPLKGAKEFMEWLRDEGYQAVVHTTRMNSKLNNMGVDEAKKFIEEWLEENKIPFHRVWDREGKPLAFAYVDDRAVPCTPIEGSEVQAYAIAQLLIKKLDAAEV